MQQLIVEDVLLLLVDDTSGVPAGATTLSYTLGGAILADLAILGRARVEQASNIWKSATVHSVPGAELNDPILRDALSTIEQKVRGSLDVLNRLGSSAREPVIDRLVERGILTRERTKWLGILPSTTWPTRDAAHERALRDELRRVLVNQEAPTPRTAAIVALVHASGTLDSVLKFPDADRGAVRTRAAAIAEGIVGVDTVSDAVKAAQAAVMAGVTAAIAAAVTVSVTAATAPS